MKKQFYKLTFLIVTLCVNMGLYAQVDFNNRIQDDLGEVNDNYQEYFFEALKQKGIENYERAIDVLQECLKIDDSKPVIYFELGKNYNQLKQWQLAENNLKKAIEMQPDNEWFLDELYDVYYRQDDIENAIITVKQLAKYHPDYKQDLATLYIRQEKFDEALQLLEEIDRQLGPDEVRNEMRNNIYSLSGNADAEIENLKRRISENPDNENNYLQLIYRYGQIGNGQEAFSTAKQLLAVKPDSKFVHMALYKFYLDEGNIDKSVTSMKIVLQADEIGEREKSKVLQDFVAFVEKNPEYQKDLIEATDDTTTQKGSQSLSDLGRFYLNSGDKQKALENYKKALAQNPNDFKLLRDVILVYIELKDYDSALKQSDSALELYPAQPILYLLKGVSELNLGDPKYAIDSLEIGLDFLVENPQMERDFYIQLSEAYTQTNNNSKAQAFAKKAKSLNDQ